MLHINQKIGSEGMTLIHVLIVLFMLSLLSLHMLQQGLLLKMRNGRFNHWIQKEILKENAITSIEHSGNMTNQSWVRFVPDHLEYDCQEGIGLYRLSSEELEVTLAIR